MARSVVLPSGAKLEITVSDFETSKALYQALLEEMKSVPINMDSAEDTLKNILCSGLSSKKIERCMTECMGRATYNGLKISSETWEPIEARSDYILVCVEVSRDNVLPFTKSLFAQYADLFAKLKSTLGLTGRMTAS